MRKLNKVNGFRFGIHANGEEIAAAKEGRFGAFATFDSREGKPTDKLAKGFGIFEPEKRRLGRNPNCPSTAWPLDHWPTSLLHRYSCAQKTFLERFQCDQLFKFFAGSDKARAVESATGAVGGRSDLFG